MNLPIDVISNTAPPRFRWRQRVGTPAGMVVQNNEGMLPPSVEEAVLKLIEFTKELQRINVELVERIAAQSELLSRKAESGKGKAGK